MKLRLRGNTLRLRLNQSEVRSLSEGATVESATSFGPGQTLAYRVVPGGAAPEARLEGSAIVLHLPAASLGGWAASDELTLEHEQKWNGGALRISLEKDLACAHPRQGEDHSDAFPNPATGMSHCG
jgi:hypothetical protein